jgi:cation diffusion facilitator family transporter|tara:strand:- start:1110 stop:2048 length:939 start_codon:yes stop_codon:yes gene_type:complete
MRKPEDGMRITWIGLWVNLLLGLIKTLAGWSLGSKALIADGMHSLLDLLSDIAVLLGLSMARRPEDENHHFGHHKFVSFAKFFIGGILIVFSISLVVSSLLDFRSGVGVAPVAGSAACVAIVSILVKEALFWWTRGVAKRLHSDLLMANAWHHRMDSISSVGVAVALLGVWLGGADWAFLDGAVTLVLGCYLVFEAAKIFLRACSDLLDAAPEREVIEDLREHILPTPGALAYHDFRVRRVGDVYEIDLHLQVDPRITVEKGHRIAREVKLRLREQHPEVSKVLVHVEPANAEHLLKRGISGAGVVLYPDKT